MERWWFATAAMALMLPAGCSDESSGSSSEPAADRESEEPSPTVLADEFVMRDPIVVLPDGVPACGASDIEFNRGADMGLGFLMFFNRGGRACGLLDYPTLEGLDEDGVWRTMPTVRSLGSSYTDGPVWTGVFDPRFTAVLSIRPQDADHEVGDCVRGTGADQTFSQLRLVLSDQRDTITLTDVVFELGECKPRVLLWAYDSTDA